MTHRPESTSFFQAQELSYLHQNQLDHDQSAQQSEESQQQPYHIVGQLWDSYIVLQSSDGLYYIDQHALAERILFEQLKKKLISDKLKPTPLLQPITFQVGRDQIIEDKIEKINAQRGFDITPLTQSSIIIYSVPQVFQEIPIDLEKIFSILLYQENINMDMLLDEIRATKACKAAIKAGEKLSHIQMQELIRQGFHHIPGMFVCQHGRPFFIKIDKKEIDKLFNRQ
jgi:DNA mismatch repair protein MutL